MRLLRTLMLLNFAPIDGGNGGGPSPVPQQTAPAPQAPPSAPMPPAPSTQPSFDRTGGMGTPPQGQAPQSPQGGPPTPVSAPAPVPGQGGFVNPAYQQTPTPDAAPEWTSVTDYLRENGVQGNFQDAQAALQYLVSQATAAQRNAPYAQIGQQYAGQAEEFQRYLALRNVFQPPAQAQTPTNPLQALMPPTWDPSWARYVQEDQMSGGYVPVPGADPKYAKAANEYAHWMQNGATRLAQEGPAAIQQYVDQRAQEIANQAVQQQLQSYQQRQEADNIVRQNASWLHERDGNGNVVVDGAGRPVFSAEGRAYYQAVQELDGNGIKDYRVQNRMAMQLVHYKKLLAAAQAQQGQPQQAPAPGAMRQQNVAGNRGLTPPQRVESVPGSQGLPQPTQTYSLLDAMRDGMAQAGVTDQQLRENWYNG